MSDQSKPKGLKRYLRPGEGEALLLVLPPLIVAALAQLLFELNAFDLVDLGRRVAARIEVLASPNLAGHLAILDDRVTWTLTVFLSLVSGLALTAVAALILCRSVRLRGLRLFVPTTLLLILCGIVSFLFSALGKSPISGLFSFTYESLTAQPGLPFDFLVAVRIEVIILNLLSIVAPVASLMAACSTLAPPKDGAEYDLVFLGGQVKSLKALVVLGSIYMVTGVVHLGVWLRWPAILIGDADLAEQMHENALALSLYWGGAFTVLIAAFYAPAMVALNKRAQEAIARLEEGTSGLTPKQFLEEHGLSLQVSKQLPQIAAVLAPVLAGPIGSAIIDLSKALPGAQ